MMSFAQAAEVLQDASIFNVSVTTQAEVDKHILMQKELGWNYCCGDQ